MAIENPNLEPNLPPNPYQVEGALLELEDHNRRHTGMAKVMGRFIKALIENADVVDSDNFDGLNVSEPNISVISDEDEVAEAQLSEDLLAFTTDSIFDSMGLLRVGGATLYADGDKATLSKQELLVVQPSRFSEYLESVRGTLENFPASKSMIENAYTKILNIIEESTSDRFQNSEFVQQEALEMLKRLQPVYATLVDADGVDIPLQRGLSYINWGDKEEFGDFLKARDLGLREPGSFSASEWHLDSTGENMLSRWNNIFEHYDKVLDSYGDKSSLAELMKSEAIGALSATDDWLKNPTYDNDNYVGSLRSSFIKIKRLAAQRGLILGDPEQN